MFIVHNKQVSMIKKQKIALINCIKSLASNMSRHMYQGPQFSF